MAILSKFYRGFPSAIPNYNRLQLNGFFKKIIGRRKDAVKLSNSKWLSKIKGLSSHSKHKLSFGKAHESESSSDKVSTKILTKSFYDKINNDSGIDESPCKSDISFIYLNLARKNKSNDTLRLSQTFVRSNRDGSKDDPSFSELLLNESLITRKNDVLIKFKYVNL